eukprot:818124-Pelagomonas_calceolata.AAC.3
MYTKCGVLSLQQQRGMASRLWVDNEVTFTSVHQMWGAQSRQQRGMATRRCGLTLKTSVHQMWGAQSRQQRGMATRRCGFPCASHCNAGHARTVERLCLRCSQRAACEAWPSVN